MPVSNEQRQFQGSRAELTLWRLSLAELTKAREVEASVVREAGGSYRTAELVRELEAEMIEAAESL